MSRMKRDDLVEEITWFLKCGVHPELIAQELHTTVWAVERRLRHSDPDLVRPFTEACYARRRAA